MSEPTRWFPYPAADSGGPGAVRLYCLPHAGGSASVFRPWIGRVPGADVCPVQPPGREGRLDEPALRRMEPLAAGLATAILADLDASGTDRYAVYGHSLGALVGYEAVREIRHRGGPLPEHLLVSGSGAPESWQPNDEAPVAGMSPDQLAALLRRIGGTPEWLLANPTLLTLLLPPFRADYEIKESYRHRPEHPLRVPLTAFFATADPCASAAETQGWRHHTTLSFDLRILHGGHFAVLEQPDLTRAHIAHALRTHTPLTTP